MKQVLRILVALLCAWVLTNVSFCALASSTPEPTLLPSMVPEPMDGQVYQYLLYYNDAQGYIRRMKGILEEKDYYVSSIPEEDRKSDFFDNNTLLAINDCCQHNGLPASDFGITQVAYDAIMSGKIVSRNAMVPDNLSPIYPESAGLNVSEIQNKLTDLHFDKWKGPYRLKPGVYDEEMYRMVRNYAERKNYEMEGESISPELQFMILNDDEEYQDAPPSVKDFFLKPVSLFGLMVPRYIQWLACLVLVGIIALLIIYFFVPGNKKAEPPIIKSKDAEVEFEIEYQGKSHEYQCSIGPALQIGRMVGRFPIDTNDREISRNHCEIYRNGLILMLKDHSTYGTYINDQLCQNREQQLYNGDKLKVGAHYITIRFRGVQ